MTVIKLLRGRYRLNEIVSALVKQGAATPIPWCAEHDHPMDDSEQPRCTLWWLQYATTNSRPVPCRLEEPQAVYRIKGTT